MFYNLAKLLSDEPEKLERVIILFIKLLVTFIVSSFITEGQISFKSLISDDGLISYTPIQILAFAFYFTLIWVIFWGFLAELVFYELILFIFSICSGVLRLIFNTIYYIFYFFRWKNNPFKRISNAFIKDENIDVNKDSFSEIINLLEVGNITNNIIHPGPRIIWFSRELEKYVIRRDNPNSDKKEVKKSIFEIKSRIHQYTILLSVTFWLMFFSEEINLPNWAFWVVILVTFNVFTCLFILNQAHNYIIDNIDNLHRQFKVLEYVKMVHDSLMSNEIIKREYQISDVAHRMFLKRINGKIFIPVEIRIRVMSHYNHDMIHNTLGELLKRNENKIKQDIGIYEIVISKVEASDEVRRVVNKNPNLIFVQASNESEIFNRVEEAVFRACDMYSSKNTQKTSEVKRNLNKAISNLLNNRKNEGT